MAELSKENLELELRRSADGEEGKPTPTHKLCPVPDLMSWASAFSHYAGIVVRAYLDKAGALWTCPHCGHCAYGSSRIAIFPNKISIAIFC